MKNSSPSYCSLRLNPKWCAQTFNKTLLIYCYQLQYYQNYCYILYPQLMKGRHSCICVYVTGFINLHCRCPYSAEFRNEWICTSNPTCAMTSCKKTSDFSENNFDFLMLEIHKVCYRCVKITYYSNILHTLKMKHCIT